MITFLKNWINQIIIAVVIATIIEMILPNGNNRKYIKMIIGLYVLFAIIQPIVTKVTRVELDILEFNYEKYFGKDILETSTGDFEENNYKLIKQKYIDNIKNDIQAKIKQKGYKIITLSINLTEDEKEEVDGTIKNISLKIEKIQEKAEEVTNSIEIENVNVNILNNSDSKNVGKSRISDKEKDEIIKYIANEYSIEKQKIIVN